MWSEIIDCKLRWLHWSWRRQSQAATTLATITTTDGWTDMSVYICVSQMNPYNYSVKMLTGIKSTTWLGKIDFFAIRYGHTCCIVGKAIIMSCYGKEKWIFLLILVFYIRTLLFKKTIHGHHQLHQYKYINMYIYISKISVFTRQNRTCRDFH